MALPTLNSHKEFQDMLQSGKPFLIKFTAQWCGGCQAMTPVLEEAAREVGDGFPMYDVDIGANQETALQFGITSIPVLILFKDGDEVKRLGMAKKADIVAAVTEVAGA
ncbi:MAG: thioredoxin family protein [Planctomycetota bacterium]